MKRGKVLLTVLVVLAVLFASCSNGMSKDDADGAVSTKAVAVSLSLGGEAENISQKAVALDDQNSNVYYYYYLAKPNWTNDDIRGRTTDGQGNDIFVPVGYANNNSDYEDYFALGYFIPGNWTFKAQIKASDNSTILYEGTNSNVSISNAVKEVVIPMTLKRDGGATGRVTINVAVPKISENTLVKMKDGENLIAQNSITQTHNSKIDTSGNITAPSGWERFNITLTPTTGNHTFILNYVDGVDAQGRDIIIGGAAVAFTVKNGEVYNVWGTIENGKYQIAALTLSMPEDIEIHLTTNVDSVIMDGLLTAEITEQDCTTYQWLVNGEPKAAGAHPYEFTLDTSAPGTYEIECVATKTINNETVITYTKKEVTVTPPAKVITIISKVGGKNIKEAPQGSTIECTAVCPPALPNGTITWYLNGALQQGNTNEFSFNLTADSTVACKVTNGTVVAYGEKTITIPNNP